MSERTIVVGNETWTYRIGRGSVVIRDSDRKSYVVPLTEITGMQWNDIDHDRWTRNLHVIPQQIAAWIAKKQAKP